MNFLENLWIALTSNYVGQDEHGNKYYIAKFQDPEGVYRRRVVYNGIPDPTKIPISWYSWLHQHTNELPQKLFSPKKKHMPNFTGTSKAYKVNTHSSSQIDERNNFKQGSSWIPQEEE